MKTIALPNGMRVKDASRRGAAHVYDEVFVRECYHGNGIEIRDGDTICDIGANVGLFSLWLGSFRKDLTIHLFEPVPQTFEAMQENIGMELSIENTFIATNAALGSGNGTAILMTCPRLTQWSSHDSWSPEHRDENMLNTLHAMDDSLWGWITKRLPACVKLFVARRILNWHEKRRTEAVRQMTWSSYADKNGIGRVDLFKIDVEGSEVEVLKGIAERHWPGIKQLVIECHSFLLACRVEKILKAHGYKVTTDCNGLPMVYARREPCH